MLIEEYHKSKGGAPFFSIYFRYGGVGVAVSDMKAKDKDSAKTKVVEYLKKALEEVSHE